MDDQNITIKIKSLISETLTIDDSQLTDDIGPGDLPQWDSLAHQSIINRIEEEYSIAFTVDEMLDMESLFDIVETVKGSLSN